MKILFIKTSDKSFVEQDLKILQKHFGGVIVFKYDEQPPWKHILSQIQLLIFLLRNIWDSQLIYIWFASYHSLLPTLFSKMFNKKSILVIGGHDASKVPEFSYGAHIKKTRSWFVKKSANLASTILTVSEFTNEHFFRYVDEANRQKTRVVYNGVDDRFLAEIPITKKENIIFTVCGTAKVNILKIKGVDFFVSLAPFMPDYNFHVYGLSGKAKKYLENNLPRNVSILPYSPLDELHREYLRTKIVCQFSHHEAFGLAMAEAMACKCIPIGSQFGGIPEVIGKAGFLIDEFDVEKAIQAIRQAISNAAELGERARQRIAENFSLAIREEKLIEIVKQLVG
jgi:glycosyltransferase involved in cell wall biosynthesis